MLCDAIQQCIEAGAKLAIRSGPIALAMIFKRLLEMSLCGAKVVPIEKGALAPTRRATIRRRLEVFDVVRLP